MEHALIERAGNVLRLNDRGHYTVPTPNLYPFQWNWDSCLSALGLAHFNEDRAWTELDTLFAHQWPDGMVPHIVFHERDEDYFPGPEVWRTGRDVPTSGITQPPVAGFVVRRLVETARDRALAEKRARRLLAPIHTWHQWFFRCRDPGASGLTAIVHPWESGRDNSVDWDTALARVPTDGLDPFTRCDTRHANPVHRPTLTQYERYIWLVQKFRDLDWDNARLHDASPFRVVCPTFNAILIRSCADLAHLAARLGETDIASQSRAFAKRGLEAMETLWSETHGQYLCLDRTTGAPIPSLSVGGLLAVFAPIPPARTAAIAARIGALGKIAAHLVPSHDPETVEFDRQRYWRGPVWLIVNYMIADGLIRAGETRIARRIGVDSVRLVQRSGFAEYYDPHTGEPCGSGQFTWTAAMLVAFLVGREAVA